MFFKSTKIKVGRKEFDVNETDLILDNGACYQIFRQNREGKYCFYNDLSKKLFRELQSLDGVYTNEHLQQAAVRNLNKSCTYWKFRIGYMIEHLGYEEVKEQVVKKRYFKEGDRVYHKHLNQFGTFVQYKKICDEECYVEFLDQDNYTECKCVSLSQLMKVCKHMRPNGVCSIGASNAGYCTIPVCSFYETERNY